MEIQKLPSALQFAQPTLKASGGSLPPDVQPGQMLAAVVETKLSNNQLLIKLVDTGQLLRASTPLDLKPGEPLRLEVVKLGMTPELKILPPEVKLPPEAQAVQQAFRQFLPQQQSLASFAGALNQAAGFEGAPATPLQEAVRTVLKSLPQKAELVTAKGLKSAFENSGVFREAQLAAGASSEDDLKSQLLSLAQTLKSLQSQTPATATQAQPGRVMTEKAAMDQGAVQEAIQMPVGQAQDKAPQALPPDKEASAGLTQEPAKSSAAKPEAPVQAQEKAQHSPEALVQPKNLPIREFIQSSTQSQPTDSAEVVPNRPEVPAQEKAQAESNIQQPKALDVEKQAASPPAKMPEASLPQAKEATLDMAADKLIQPKDKPDTTDLNQPNKQSEATRSGENVQPLDKGPVPQKMEEAAHHQTLKHAEQAQAASVLESQESASEIKSLLHKTEGALARIVLDQLASIPKPDEKQIIWQIEIPYTDGKHSDAAKLKIVQEGGGGGPKGPKSGQAYWSVVLELNPPGIGTVHSRIMLSGEKIDSCFWSDQKATSALIEQNLGLLSARLEQVGLKIGQLSSLSGAPPSDKPFEKPPTTGPLLNERA